MDTDTVDGKTVADGDGHTAGDIEAMLNESGLLEEKEEIQKVGKSLIRLELDLVCSSEKLFNLSLLMMHVAVKESDFENFASEKEDDSVDSAVQALEFDILFGICDSEVGEMDKFVGQLQVAIDHFRKLIAPHKHLGEAFSALEDKLHDSEELMTQSQGQVSELMIESANFQNILSSFSTVERCEDKNAVYLENSNLLSPTSTIQRQTYLHHRHTLSMLEKSLARELDLEKKLTESTQALEDVKFKLSSSNQEVLSLEEESAAVYAHFLKADNVSTMLMGSLKHLIGQLKKCQLTINSALQRENELNSRLQSYMQAVQRMENEGAVLLQHAEVNNSEVLMLKEKVNTLEMELNASKSSLLIADSSDDVNEENNLKELLENMIIGELRAEKAKDECKLLAEVNEELNEELTFLRSSCISREKVDSLEKQLTETNYKLYQAMTSVEASQEKQSMLYTTIEDMDILIENLKLKASIADDQVDSAEDKLIILSENNAELKEELNFLQSKLGRLEVSLQQAEETKLETAKDINIRAKVITDLVVRLAIEREQLQKQISFVMKENKALVDKLDMSNKTSSNSKHREMRQNEKGDPISQCHVKSIDKGKGKEVVCDATKVEKSVEDVSDFKCKSDMQDVKSKLKYVFLAVLAALIHVLAFCFLLPERCSFST